MVSSGLGPFVFTFSFCPQSFDDFSHALLLVSLAERLPQLKLISDVTNKKERTKYMGFLGACIGSAFVFGTRPLVHYL